MNIAEFADWLANHQFSRKVVRIQNHHTWKPSYAQFHDENHFALLEGMYNYHVKERGWANIGQNLTTFPDGTVAVCRPFEDTPACIKGANTGGICIEHIGDFDIGRDVMTQEQKDCIVRINALLCMEYGIAPDTNGIVYHHWYDLDTGERNESDENKKSCPGTAFFGGNNVEDCRDNFIPLVVRDLQSLGSPVAGNAGPTPALTVLRQGRVTSPDGKLSVRTGPDKAKKELKVLKNGDIVDVFATSGHWCRISSSAQQWVNGTYLAAVQSEPHQPVVGNSAVAAASGEEYNLLSTWFAGDSTLEAIADGHGELGKSPNRLDATARLQRGLNRLAASHPEYLIDLGAGGKHSGFFGPKTEASVYEFQVDQGLPKTGIVNQATMQALDGALANLDEHGPQPANPATPSPLPMPDGESVPSPDAIPIGAPAVWRTGAGFAQDTHDTAKGWARTTGISGTSQRYSDGTVILDGVETLSAKRRNTVYPTIAVRQRRFIKDGTHHIEQGAYCRSGRALAAATFIEHHSGIAGQSGWNPGYSTRFGKSDDMDEGTGSEAFGVTQTSSEVCGCSVKKSILVSWFGQSYQTNPARLTAMVEVYYPATRRYVKVPLTDVGPSESVRAKIDLTWAVDQFLGTDGGDDVYFRLVQTA